MSLVSRRAQCVVGSKQNRFVGSEVLIRVTWDRLRATAAREKQGAGFAGRYPSGQTGIEPNEHIQGPGTAATPSRATHCRVNTKASESGGGRRPKLHLAVQLA